MTNTVFSRILVVNELESKAMTCLDTWFSTYLRQLELDNALESDSIRTPDRKYFTNRNNFDAIPGEELPKVVVVSPGLLSRPVRDNRGQYRAVWRLGVGVACAAETEEEAKFHCDIYGAAVRAIMLHQGGKALEAKIEWLDESYVDLPIPDQIQMYRAAAVWFSVDVENVVTKRGGPLVPNEAPYAYGKANTVTVTLVKEPIDG